MSAPTIVRTLRFLALALQLALPSLGVIADAHLEIGGRDESIHVESENHDCGQQGHPEHCALCQFLRTPVLAADADHEVWLDGAVERTPPAQAEFNAARKLLLSLPRGPPLFS